MLRFLMPQNQLPKFQFCTRRRTRFSSKMASAPRRPSQIHVLSNVVGLVDDLASAMPDFKFIDIPNPVDEKNYTAEQTVTGEQVKYLQEAEILVADPLLLGAYVQEIPNLKWVQSTWAGVDSIMNRLDKNKPLPNFPLARLAGHFGPAMAEFTVGQILAHERSLIDLYEDQKKKEWLGRERATYRLLSTLSIGIIGLGDIGLEVARCCKTFGMTVCGVVRRNRPKEMSSEFVDRYFLNTQLTEVLKSCDYICNLLPSTPETRGLLSGDAFSVCKKKKPVFINVGRGDVVDEASILKAVKSEWISKAILDVFEVEPLPKESLLWDEPKVVICPHVSAISPPSMVTDIFKENMERYMNGEPLKYVIDWKSGY